MENFRIKTHISGCLCQLKCLEKNYHVKKLLYNVLYWHLGRYHVTPTLQDMHTCQSEYLKIIVKFMVYTAKLISTTNICKDI